MEYLADQVLEDLLSQYEEGKTAPQSIDETQPRRRPQSVSFPTPTIHSSPSSGVREARIAATSLKKLGDTAMDSNVSSDEFLKYAKECANAVTHLLEKIKGMDFAEEKELRDGTTRAIKSARTVKHNPDDEDAQASYEDAQNEVASSIKKILQRLSTDSTNGPSSPEAGRQDSLVNEFGGSSSKSHIVLPTRRLSSPLSSRTSTSNEKPISPLQTTSVHTTPVKPKEQTHYCRHTTPEPQTSEAPKEIPRVEVNVKKEIEVEPTQRISGQSVQIEQGYIELCGIQQLRWLKEKGEISSEDFLLMKETLLKQFKARIGL